MLTFLDHLAADPLNPELTRQFGVEVASLPEGCIGLVGDEDEIGRAMAGLPFDATRIVVVRAPGSVPALSAQAQAEEPSEEAQFLCSEADAAAEAARRRDWTGTRSSDAHGISS
jgi:hypothetical protein